MRFAEVLNKDGDFAEGECLETKTKICRRIFDWGLGKSSSRCASFVIFWKK